VRALKDPEGMLVSWLLFCSGMVGCVRTLRSEAAVEVWRGATWLTVEARAGGAGCITHEVQFPQARESTK